MPSFGKRVRNRLIRALADKGQGWTFSQCGEDRIVQFLFESQLHLANPTYLDIGANDPIALNNSYLMSLRGAFGVLVEPDPDLYARIRRLRPKDRCLNVGVSDNNEKSAAFFVFEQPEFNTFSAESAAAYERRNLKLKAKIEVPLRSINEIIEENFPASPNFVTIDAEGFDERIVKSLDLNRFRPRFFASKRWIMTPRPIESHI